MALGHFDGAIPPVDHEGAWHLQVGTRLDHTLAMGRSRPSPAAFEAFIGTREIDGSALVRHFRPLRRWLQMQNEGRRCGG